MGGAVIFSPVWRSRVPVLLKGFIDRTILPRFGFKFHEKGIIWNKLLKGRSGHIIRTTNTPRAWSKFVILDPDIRILKHATMHFCGIRPVKVTSINNLKNSTEQKRQKAIQKVIRSVPPKK
jgi:putative NADPH-quinone reductase